MREEHGPVNLRILCAEELLRKLAGEFNQDPMGTAIRVPKEGHDDVSVAELEERRRAVSRKPSELTEQSKLDALPAVREPLLRRS